MKRFVVAGFMALAIVAPAGAHHSISAEFDSNRPVTFTGTVTKIEWTNPHIYTHVAVKEADGKVVEYKVEGGPPNALYRAGWRKDSLQVGNHFTVDGWLAKSGAKLANMRSVLLADGRRVLGGSSGGAN